MKNVIELTGARFSYPGGIEALRGASVAVPEGKRVAFLGENGSGKSTLFMVFNGTCRLTAGEFRFRGEPVRDTRAARSALVRQVGVVFQDPDVQLFAPTVYQEISFGPKNLDLSDAEIAERVERAMEMTGITQLRDRAVHFLSHGEKKRVAIADILAMDTPVIVLDEPFAGLDLPHQRMIMAILDRLSGSGKTVILSTHSPDMAWSWADHVCLMKEGLVVGAGDPAAVFTDDALLAAASMDPPFLVSCARALRLPAPPRTREEFLRRIAKP